LKIKTDRLRLPKIRKQKNINKLRVVTTSSSSMLLSNIIKELEQQTAPMITKFLSPKI
jgi:hypothetical protein